MSAKSIPSAKSAGNKAQLDSKNEVGSPNLGLPNEKTTKLSYQTQCRLMRYEVQKNKLDSCHPRTELEKLLILLDGNLFILIFTVVVIYACTLTFVELFGVTVGFADVSNTVVAGIFIAEVVLRFIAMGPKQYFTTPLCWIDFLATATDAVALVLADSKTQLSLKTIKLLRLVRLLRLNRLAFATGVPQDQGPAQTKDEVGRILSYDTAALFSLGFVNLYGTIFMIPEIWAQFLFLVVLSTVWALFVCEIECDQSDACGNCVRPISYDTSNVLSTMVAFMLGFFINLTFQRWWRMREILNRFIEELSTGAHLVSMFVKGSTESSAKYRYCLVRYLNLSACLFTKELAQTSDFRDLVENGRLMHAEWDLLEGKRTLHVHVHMWISHLLKHLAAEGALLYSEVACVLISESMSRQRAAVSELKMYRKAQIPYAYTHLMTCIVKINLLLVCGVAGSAISAGMFNKDWLAVVMSYFVVLINNLVLEGLLRIHVVLYDPFGEDVCDFPLSRYMENAWIQTCQVLHLRSVEPVLDLDALPTLAELPADADEPDDIEFELKLEELRKEADPPHAN